MTLEVTDEVRTVWDASTAEKRRLAHWEPKGDDVERMRRFIEHDEFGMPYGAWLDWGCGGGALLRALDAAQLEPTEYIAVDVSKATFDHLPTDLPKTRIIKLEPHETTLLNAASVDVLCSFSAFQHFPSRQYGLEVLREMRRLAKPGALGFVQTRFYEPGDRNDPANVEGRPYSERYLFSCAYQVSEFWSALQRAGFTPSSVELEPYRGYAWYRFTA